MKFLLCSIGTRGDMEPFLAIGDVLARAGHEVVCVMPEQFRELVADTGHAFAPLDRRFMDLIDGEAGQAIMGQKGNVFNRLRAYGQLIKDSLKIQKVIIQEQRDYIAEHKPDRVVCHPKCIYARVWGMKHTGKAICASPIPNMTHPVSESSHIGFSKDFGPWGNRLSFRLVNNITALMAARYARPFKADFPNLKLSRSAILAYFRQKERVLYQVSPSLISRPEDWPESAKIMGYYERTKTNNWEPGDGLLNFLRQHSAKKITFITFGSMVNDDPEGKTRSILKVLAKHKIPAIINTSSGGLVAMKEAPDHVHFVNNIPYEWIFPKVHSIVHHGGSGTSHTCLKHGCASLIIPHIIDQFFWNQKLAKLGVGPLGVKVKKLTEKSFEPLLLELRSKEGYKRKAVQLQLQMKEEGKDEALLEELEK